MGVHDHPLAFCTVADGAGLDHPDTAQAVDGAIGQHVDPVAEDEQIETVTDLGAQPSCGTTNGDRRIQQRCAGKQRRIPRITILGVECAVAVSRGQRQPPAVDQPARELVSPGQRQHGVAEHAAHVGLGRDEIGGPGGVEDVLVGRLAALVVIAREQRHGRFSLDDACQLPAEIVGILDAAVAATRAERRDLMRRVADEDHPVMDESLQPPALEGIDAHPFERERPFAAEHGAQPGQHALGPLLVFRIGIGSELEIDPPHVVRLTMQQHRLVAMERRVEPEPALGGKVAGHAHVGDEEAVVEHLPGKGEPHSLAHRAARAVGGDDPVGAQAIRAPGRFDLERDAVVVLHHAGAAVLPPDLAAERRQPREQSFFQVVLLEVDERRAAVPVFGQQVELVGEPIADEHLADTPTDTAIDHGVAATEAIEDFEGALGVADRARSGTHGVVVIDHDRLHAVQRQIDGAAEPYRSGTDDHDRRRRRRRVRRRDISLERRRLVTGVHRCVDLGRAAACGCPAAETGQSPSSWSHISRSRCAVQMRGSRMPLASS